jgi:hypothetical protein
MDGAAATTSVTRIGDLFVTAAEKLQVVIHTCRRMNASGHAVAVSGVASGAGHVDVFVDRVSQDRKT